MLKRPSSRRHSTPQQIQINLVPMLDALVTMISFLMYTMAFMSLTMIDSPLPTVSKEENRVLLEGRPLQLTLSFQENGFRLWSPFQKIEESLIPKKPDGTPDHLKLHEKLLVVKQAYPSEEKIVLMPEATTSYDSIIRVLDAVRFLEKTDPPVTLRDPKSGTRRLVSTLFPEAVFGNLLGGTD
jgi:biopolymer transport protein ExbD